MRLSNQTMALRELEKIYTFAHMHMEVSLTLECITHCLSFESFVMVVTGIIDNNNL